MSLLLVAALRRVAASMHARALVQQRHQMNAQETKPILTSNAYKNMQMESPTSLLTPIVPTQFIHAAFQQSITEQGSCAWSSPAKDEQRKPIVEHVGEINGPLNIRI